MENKLRETTDNFTKGFYSSTLLAGDGNWFSGEVIIDGVKYWMVKHYNKVRIWDTPKNYMAWINGDKDYILEVEI